jgi:hypothetical protein
MICIFCNKAPGDPTPWCTDNPGEGCTYGMHHEFPGSEFDPKVKKPAKQPVKKADKQVCVKCNLHAKNPASASNGCVHEYPVES